MIQKINTSEAPAPIGPYSQATIANGFIFISGQIPINPSTGDLIEGDIVAETAQVMKNLKAILEEAGSSFTKVTKCSIFVRNMGDFAKINEEYGKSFTENKPARETVEVSGLPKNVNVEISCIALV